MKRGSRGEKELIRIQKQRNMTLSEMIKEIPKGCDRGSKKK
jgi:hypothetical protein